jgi:HK97 family phage portal protein
MSRWDDLVAMAAESGVRITPETAMKTAAYFACARVVAETVGSLPLHLYRRLDDHNSERAKDLPLYNVLAKRPNRWQTRYEWVEQMCLHLGFYGNSYQFKVAGDRGSVSELRPLNPAGMKVVQEGDMSLSYVYTDPSTGRQQAYRDDQIMHVRWLSFDGIHGEVPVELGKDAIGLARALEQYAAAFYKNNAQPGIVLHTDQALPREVREQLRDQWEAAHRGPAKAGRTAILSNGLKADTVSATNQESQLAELWMQSLLAICRVWRMPPHMIQELGRATWGNLQSEMVSFEKFTIAPWLRRIEGAIERDVLPEDGDLYAEFLVEGLLRGDITSRYAAYEVAIRNRWMTPEEVRMKENLGPMPESEDDSPGEAEDTAGDATKDVTEGEDPASETNQSGTMTTHQPSGRSLPLMRFNEDQPRDESGKWASGGGGDSGSTGTSSGSGTQSAASTPKEAKKQITKLEKKRDRELSKVDKQAAEDKEYYQSTADAISEKLESNRWGSGEHAEDLQKLIESVPEYEAWSNADSDRSWAQTVAESTKNNYHEQDSIGRVVKRPLTDDEWKQTPEYKDWKDKERIESSLKEKLKDSASAKLDSVVAKHHARIDKESAAGKQKILDDHVAAVSAVSGTPRDGDGDGIIREKEKANAT